MSSFSDRFDGMDEYCLVCGRIRKPPGYNGDIPSADRQGNKTCGVYCDASTMIYTQMGGLFGRTRKYYARDKVFALTEAEVNQLREAARKAKVSMDAQKDGLVMSWEGVLDALYINSDNPDRTLTIYTARQLAQHLCDKGSCWQNLRETNKKCAYYKFDSGNYDTRIQRVSETEYIYYLVTWILQPSQQGQDYASHEPSYSNMP